MKRQITRRKFLRGTALAITLPAVPVEVLAQTTRQRLEWQAFKTTTQYDSLLSAIAKMKANTNPADPASWSYWVNIHHNQCPHGVAYFLAWHRGYLYYLERQLKAVSGNANLTLPYWDYYLYSNIPEEFTNPASPLYVPRANVDVRQALSLAPFSSTLTSFPNGTKQAFEPSIETAPHNQLHNLVGEVMSTMDSPVDPIFWLHHANVDRLWVAWIAAGNGRKMPSISNIYWQGSHKYNTLTLRRSYTSDAKRFLYYTYQNETFPTALPPTTAAKAIQPELTKQGTALFAPPATESFAVAIPGETSGSTFSIGGARNLGLSRRSVSAQISVPSDQWLAVKQILEGRPTNIPGSTKVYNSVHLVLDNIELQDGGKRGGYFYRIYLTVPSLAEEDKIPPLYLGGVGPFEVNAASHHGNAQLRYSIDKQLSRMSKLRAVSVTVSFVRVDGDNSPDGAAIGIGEARLELSTKEEKP